MIFFSSTNLHRIEAFELYESEKEQIETINKALETIPKDKSIKSTTFFIPALWNRNEIYEYTYSDEETDYVIFDLRWSEKEHSEFLDVYYNFYERVYYEDNLIEIYKAK